MAPTVSRLSPSVGSMSQNGKKVGATVGSKKPLKQGSLFSFFSKKEKAPSGAGQSQQSLRLESAPSFQNAESDINPKAPTVSKSLSQNTPLQSEQEDPSSNKRLSEQIKIGDTLEVYWVDDDEWYQAKVIKQKQSSSMFYIQYIIDQQSEWIDLLTESFRLLANNTTDASCVRKRRILHVDDNDHLDQADEIEFVLPPSDDDNYDDAEDGDDDDSVSIEDDQWMVTDDDDEVVPNKKRRIVNTPKLRTGPTMSKAQREQKNVGESSNTKSSLKKFAASTTVTQQSCGEVSKRTPNNTQNTTKTLTTPQHITPMTSASTELSMKSNSTLSATSIEKSCNKNVSTPLAATKSSSLPQKRALSQPPNFEVGALNPSGSHVHNHLPFLQSPRDSSGRTPDDPNYDCRTLQVIERDWIRINGKKMTDAVKQWWDLKAMYFDTVLLFKTGKFYEMFHMDADIGVQACGLSYMKGHVAHAGFPEISYGSMADKLVRAGYKVSRVEQTETPEQLGIRRKNCGRGSQAPKVVNREVCSILTMGTRTFCYLDDESSLLTEAASSSSVGPLLSIREIILPGGSSLENSSVIDGDATGSDDIDTVEPVCEYGITLVDAIRGSVTIGQFADDILRSRLVTLLTSFSPSEILIEGGEKGASATLRSLLRSLQTASVGGRFLIESVHHTESFPQSTAIDPYIRKQLERAGKVHPWDVSETLAELHRRQYFPRASKVQPSDEDARSVKRWPTVLRAAVEGQADLALSSLGATLFYLQRNLIDCELLSMGNVMAYVPPNTSSTSNADADNGKGIVTLSEERNFQESGLSNADSDLALSIQLLTPQSEIEQAESEVTFMALDGTTLHNLEILTNSVDQKVTGSLWSKINHTKTPHGSRLLRAWLLRPLFRKDHIERRQDAVEELVGGSSAMAMKEARSILSKCGDIERLLSRVHSMSGSIANTSGEDENCDRIHPNDRAVLYETATYTKRKVGDFAKVLNGLRYASQIPDLFHGVEIQSGLIKKIVTFTDQDGCFPRTVEDLDWFFQNFDLDQAAKGLFEPCTGIDDLYDSACGTIERILADLKDYKDQTCNTILTPRALAKSEWKYINTKPDSKDKYLIELPASIAVPDNFIMKGKRGSGPKQVNKYLPPVVERFVMELEGAYDIQKERKAKGMELIFAKFDAMRSVWAAVAHSTALLDALGALAQTACKAGYTRPVILECIGSAPPRIRVLQGRHPCVEHTFNSMDFIPNDLHLGCSPSSEDGAARVLLLSGPNMGGKSTLLRQTCLIAILAQIGSFVPADHCELTPVDRIYTRLGASDRILLNQSTFFVELAETAAALRGASRRSLVIMDELGRGTSTFDGTAIASAAVQHLVTRNKCLTLFATHYHSLLEEWKGNNDVTLGHMECLVEQNPSDSEFEECNITFMYTLGSGPCPKSFGINVARLAGLPDEVLAKAKRISSEFEVEMSCAELPEVSVQQKQRIVNAIHLGDWIELVHLWETLQNPPIDIQQ